MTKPSSQILMWCKRLRLGEQFATSVQSGKGKEREFMLDVLKEEVVRRDAVAAENRIKSANFPELKTLSDFEFTNVKVPDSVTMTYFTECRFVDDKYNLFLYGKPGTGKTHLAIALGIEACKRLKKVEFYRMPELIQKLRVAKNENDIKVFKRIAKLDLIIIDEFGYPPRDPDTIEILFELISKYCYEKKSLILTSNRTINEWLDDFKQPREERIAHATIDRLVQDTLLFSFGGESRRILHSKMPGTMA